MRATISEQKSAKTTVIANWLNNTLVNAADKDDGKKNNDGRQRGGNDGSANLLAADESGVFFATCPSPR